MNDTIANILNLKKISILEENKIVRGGYLQNEMEIFFVVVQFIILDMILFVISIII